MLKEKVIRILCDLIVNEVPLIVKALKLPEEMELRVTYRPEDESDQLCKGKMTFNIGIDIIGRYGSLDIESLWVYIYTDTFTRLMKEKYSSLVLIVPLLGKKIIRRELVLLLAHEYRHMWQYYTGWALRDGRADRFMPYEWRKTEKDAHNWARVYLKGGE